MQSVDRIQFCQQIPDPPAAIQIGSITGSILRDDNEFLHPFRSQLLRFGNITAPDSWNCTIGAAVVAALGDFQISCPRLGRNQPGVFSIAIQHLFAQDLGQNLSHLWIIADCQKTIDLRHFRFQISFVALSQTAYDQFPAILILIFCHFQDRIDRFLLGRLNKSAGIDDNRFRFVNVADNFMSGLPQQAHHSLTVD